MQNSTVLVLLAGGKSERMGILKGLLDFQGKPWILEQISRYRFVNKPIVYIGLGYDFKKYFKVIPWFKEALNSFYNYDGVEVKVVLNSQPTYGSFSTLQMVLKAVNVNVSVIVQPIDVPLVDEQSLKVILNKDNLVIIPTCDGKNGHPVKLKPQFWNKLLVLNITSKNARLDIQIKQLDNLSISYVKVLDNSVYQNINTQKDWLLYKKGFTLK